MVRIKRPQEGPIVPDSSAMAKRGRTTRSAWTGPPRTNSLGFRREGARGVGESRSGNDPPHWSTLKSGFKFRGYHKEVILDREELSVNYPDVSLVFHFFDARGWTEILEPQFPCYPRLVRLFYASLRVMHGTGINKTFSVSIDGSVFDIDSDDVQKAFGLGDSDNPDVNYLMWPPVLTEFPPKAEMKEELLYVRKKSDPYPQHKNLDPAICLFHMVAHRNIIPQKGNKNVLVGNMFYLVYLYTMGLSVDLVLIIMNEMFTTANPDHQTRTLPYGRFISQLLTDKRYAIRPDEEVDAMNDVINARYWEKSKKYMIVETESESDGDAEDSRAETVSARRDARPSTSRTATTPVSGTYTYVPTGLVPHDFASIYTFLEICFASMDTQIQTQFQLFREDIGRLQTSVKGFSSIFILHGSSIRLLLFHDIYLFITVIYSLLACLPFVLLCQKGGEMFLTGISEDRLLSMDVLRALVLSRGYLASVNARGTTTTGLTVSEQELRREIGVRRWENAKLIVRRFIGREKTMGSAYQVWAYTTTRTHNNGACVLFWEKHLRRLAESARIIADLRPQGIRVSSTGSWESVIGSLVDDSFRKVLPVALKERGSGDELAITTLVTWGLDHLNGDKGVCGNDEDRLVRSINAYVHVGVYVPLVFGVRENGAHLAVVGRGRDNAKAKFSQWVRFRKCLEALRPPLANELLLSNDGDRILEGCVTNFFVVCRKENADAVVEGSSDPRNTNAFEVQTASIDDGVLPGVIRQLVIEVCLDKRIPVREIAPSWSKCELWEEAFTTSK
ncbi:hypothetical protein GIB67_002171 [Kingdonia uniflora]|uniref:Putative plant transposon protein domain-containing protein n=1 Tax=Kingdonia uniflora TaxID=39325 RepID=A0A7J7KWM4_9MAGN|nr:hypothetical protein GIB67_002171 [Kingdonia uniflora]